MRYVCLQGQEERAEGLHLGERELPKFVAHLLTFFEDQGEMFQLLQVISVKI
jgi:hypothetical protein